jgi:hypothetical protein
MSPESLESLDNEGGGRTKKSPISCPSHPGDCGLSTSFKKRTMTATPAPPMSLKILDACLPPRQSSLGSLPSWKPFTTVRYSAKNDDQKPVTRVIMHKKLCRGTWGPDIILPEHCSCLERPRRSPSSMRPGLTCRMSKAHTNTSASPRRA